MQAHNTPKNAEYKKILPHSIGEILFLLVFIITPPYFVR